MSEFKQRYGPWGLVAGGAGGIGEAYSNYRAAQGLNIIVIDIDQRALDDISRKLSSEHGVEVVALNLDLASAQ